MPVPQLLRIAGLATAGVNLAARRGRVNDRQNRFIFRPPAAEKRGWGWFVSPGAVPVDGRFRFGYEAADSTGGGAVVPGTTVPGQRGFLCRLHARRKPRQG